MTVETVRVVIFLSPLLFGIQFVDTQGGGVETLTIVFGSSNLYISFVFPNSQ